MGTTAGSSLLPHLRRIGNGGEVGRQGGKNEKLSFRRQAIPRGMNLLGRRRRRRRGSGAVGTDDNVGSGAGVAVASGDLAGGLEVDTRPELVPK